MAHAPALAADLAGFVQRLAAGLDLPLRGGDFRALYDPEELAPSCQPPRPAWEELIPEALALYGRLEEIADLPSAEEPAASGRQRGLLQGSEILFHKLLKIQEDRLETGRELARLRQRLGTAEEAGRSLRQEAQVLREERDVLRGRVQVLREIESSRSFAFIRVWWWLRRAGSPPREPRKGREPDGRSPAP